MSLVSERIEQYCKRLKLIHLATEWQTGQVPADNIKAELDSGTKH